jgi:hypothetical protein
MRSVIKSQVDDFFISGYLPNASIIILFQDPGRLDKIPHTANYSTGMKKYGFFQSLSKSIDVNDSIALPKNFAIILHKLFLASFVAKELIHVFFYPVIMKSAGRAKHDLFFYITS